MKIYFLLPAAIILLFSACKKETKDLKQIEDVPVVSGKPAPCKGNKWQLDNVYYSKGGARSSLVYDNKLYVFDEDEDEIRIYDGTSWDSIECNNDVPYNAEGTIVEFMIGNKGYMGFTPDPTARNAFFEYDFAANTFTRIADFPEPPNTISPIASSTFSIGNKGYVVYDRDIWEYDPQANEWTQKASIPVSLSGRTYATGFNIGAKGYIAGGKTSALYGRLEPRKLLEYDPATDSWNAQTLFPGNARVSPAVFIISGTAYIGGGAATENPNDVNIFNDYYKYYPAANSWLKVANAPISNRSSFGFSLNSKGYVVFRDNIYQTDPILKYLPRICFGTTPL